MRQDQFLKSISEYTNYKGILSSKISDQQLRHLLGLPIYKLKVNKPTGPNVFPLIFEGIGAVATLFLVYKSSARQATIFTERVHILAQLAI